MLIVRVARNARNTVRFSFPLRAWASLSKTRLNFSARTKATPTTEERDRVSTSRSAGGGGTPIPNLGASHQVPACSGTSSLENSLKKAILLRCLALRTKGGIWV